MIAGILTIGLVLIATALKNTQHELGQQLSTDMLGTDGFLAWAGAVLGLGAIGYIPGMRTTSRYLLALLAVVVVLRNGGLFASVQTALLGASAAGPAPSIPPPATTSSSSGSGSSSGSSGSSSSSSSSGSSTASTVATVAEIAALALL